jgi:hypothetical protein
MVFIQNELIYGSIFGLNALRASLAIGEAQ